MIYFDPFYFNNGNTAKPKYFVVLKNICGMNLLASLPTRKNAIPKDSLARYGCVELPEVNCFVIPATEEVTDCGKQFDFPTYLYGHQIDDYQTSMLQDVYPNEGSDYIVWGKIKPKLFAQLIDCFKNSASVKRKYKKLLNG